MILGPPDTGGPHVRNTRDRQTRPHQARGHHEEPARKRRSAFKAGARVRGTWFGDGKRGHGLILFESEKQAQDMASHASMDPASPVQIESTAVYKVNAEA